MDMDQVFIDDLADPEAISSISHPLLHFSIPQMSSNNWTSNQTRFNYAGMSGLYDISNKTLSAIFPNYTQYLDYAENYENYSTEIYKYETVQEIVLENKGPLSFVVSISILGIILTLWGLGWLLAKCCCGCCSGPKSNDEILAKKLVHKRDKCKRAGCGMLLGALVVVFLFGLVCCFVTNEQINRNIRNMPQDMNNAVDDTQTYLDTTKAQIKSLFVTNYDTLEVLLNDILDKSGEIIKSGLGRKSGLDALKNLTDILDTIKNVRQSLESVETSSRRLKVQAKQLEVGLTERKRKLLDLLKLCNSPKCEELKNTSEIRSLRVENDFRQALSVYLPKLPNMTDLLRELGTLLVTEVRSSIDNGQKSFNELSFRIQNEVQDVIPFLREKIRLTGNELANISDALTGALESVHLESTRKNIDDFNETIYEYEPKRYVSTLGLSILLAVIFCGLALGCFIGFCGKQPGSEHSNECCSRRRGSCCINCGMFLMFLSVAVLAVVSVFYFIAAGAVTQVGCKAVNAMDSRTEVILQLPKLDIKNSHNYKVPSYSLIINSCKQGASAYEAFGLKKIYDIGSVTNLSSRFEKEINELAKKVDLPRRDSTLDIVFLTPEAKEQLDRFSNSKITRINFESFIDELTDSEITSVNLNEVIARLNETLSDPENARMGQDVKESLMNEIMYLETLQTRVLLPMLDEIRKSEEHLKTLSKDQKDLAKRIQYVADAAQKAQENLKSSRAVQQLKDLASQFAFEFVQHVDNYANFTYEQIDQNIGQCRPLFNAFNATISSGCVNVGYPLSGLFFSFTCLLLLYVPIFIVGSVLARLYKKYKTYGVYDSETYYSNAYGDGDTIPLSLSASANVTAGGARRPKRGRPSGREREGSESRNQSRYDDASHKAWGSQMAFNNHHTPPASQEYERPPPYYYPGPSR